MAKMHLHTACPENKTKKILSQNFTKSAYFKCLFVAAPPDDSPYVATGKIFQREHGKKYG